MLFDNADIIARLAPYITSNDFRKVVNSSKAFYQDIHLGQMAQNSCYGHYGKIDIALIQACAITKDVRIIFTISIKCAQTYVEKADKVIVEINITQPAELEGFHDIYRVQDPPDCQPVPLISVGQAHGTNVHFM